MVWNKLHRFKTKRFTIFLVHLFFLLQRSYAASVGGFKTLKKMNKKGELGFWGMIFLITILIIGGTFAAIKLGYMKSSDVTKYIPEINERA